MMKYLQRIGRSLMLPVSVLPAAALLLGIGYAFDPTGWGANSALAAFLIKAGASIIDNMSVLFAVGVALGMSKDKDGVAALSGMVAFLVVTTVLSSGAVAQYIGDASKVPAAFGKINNQFIGILSGVIAGELYNKFKGTELPEFLAFFSGKRSVPIITSFVMLVVSGILYKVWPIIFGALVKFGEAIMGLGFVGAGIYGFLNRLLIPLGLHHTLNSVFWFNVAGINDIGRFWGDPTKAYANIPSQLIGKYTVGMYQAGFFPVMMFGLPAAGLAMYVMAKPEQKKYVGSLMLAAGFTSFVTGVTEPMEFSFMFVAPLLYFVHAVLTGLTVAFVAAIKVAAGFGFSAGLIDFLLSLRNPNALHPLYLIPIGIVVGIIYFVVFTSLIKAFNLQTPGRGDDNVDTSALDEILGKEKKSSGNAHMEEARVILEGLGGKDNVISIDNCTTRLRLEIKDTNKIDEAKIKSVGPKAVIKLDDQAVQVIVGTKVQFVADAMKELVK